MTIVNRIVGSLFELLVWPLRGLPPLAGLAVIALVTAILMLLVVRATSNQPAIAAAKRRMEASLYEIRLFDDDPRLVLRALGVLLRSNLAYLRGSFVPLLWMLVPLTLSIAQLQSLYGYRAVRPGETFLVQAKLEPTTGNATETRPEARLRVPAGLRVETPEVWIRPLSELAWRVRAERAGRYRVELELNGTSVPKEVCVGEGLQRLSPLRRQGGFVDRILYPVEPPLPAAGRIESIRVNYALPSLAVLAWRLPWVVAYFVLALAFAFLLKGRFRVTL